MQSRTTLRRRLLQGVALSTGASLNLSAAPTALGDTSGVRAVRAFGAKGDGAQADTRPIQDAIDACAAAGGGTVYFSPGAYLSGTIFLKSGVALCLEAGATLLGSRNLGDYPVTVPKIRSYADFYTDKSLIYGEGLSNIAILGRGVIDGQGASFAGPYKARPYLIRVVGCTGVLVADVRLRDSAMWVQHYLASDEIEIRNVTVHSLVNHNNDGIDIDGCQRVRISDCSVVSGDDAIVLKSTLNRPCRDVVVTNCVLSTRCNALKLGTESNGGFDNIVVSNCTVYETNQAGIAVEMVDGGVLERVLFSNIAIQKASVPIFVRLGNRARPFEAGGSKPGMGKLRNVVISGVEAVATSETGCGITGLAGREVENVTLDNVRVWFAGGGKAEDALREVPELEDQYPRQRMFGTLPAYGFYCRHVRNLRLRNIETCLLGRDPRPALVCEDVQDLVVSGSRFAVDDGVKPVVRMRNVRDAFLHGCRSGREAEDWLELAGCDSVALAANKLG